MANYIDGPRARVILDSISPTGDRLTTIEVTMHRFVLAEFNTHRVFSRNSASSRAIPGHLHRARVLRTPAMPLEWPEKKSGMQGGTELPHEIQNRSGAIWRKAAADAVTAASKLDALGVHKSVTNRLLEPFLFQTVLVTSTEWDNFFEQRCDPAAQPEIRVPAELMRAALEQSEPTYMEYDGWHMPLINIDDDDTDAIIGYFIINHDKFNSVTEMMARVSVARCARVSYLNHDGERAIEDDLQLYDRLATYGHWSPFEHVATPVEPPVPAANVPFREHHVQIQPVPVEHKGNFTGWNQLRHMKELQ